MGKMTRSRAAAVVGVLAASIVLPATPASALVPVIDAAALTKIIVQVQQTLALVTMAKQNIAALPASITLTNVQGRMAAVTGMLQQARTLCSGSLAGKTLPSACNVSANTANAQAAQLGAEMAQLGTLQNAARGVGGAVAAQQATAHATLEVAAQLQELRQLQTARALQKQIDDQAIDGATHGASPVNPWK